MQKRINAQELQVLDMVKKSSHMFPDKKEFHKYNDGAIGYASLKKKHQLYKLDSFATVDQNSQYAASPIKFNKKTVRLMINEDNGAVRIENASPDAKPLNASARFRSSKSGVIDSSQDDAVSEKLLKQSYRNRSNTIKFPDIAQNKEFLLKPQTAERNEDDIQFKI